MVQKAAFACLIVRVDVHEQISSLLLKTVYAKLSTQRTLGTYSYAAICSKARELSAHCGRVAITEPGWRNWQTQRTQNPPRATSWGFDPPSRHQRK
jgi:hypothetical protein